MTLNQLPIAHGASFDSKAEEHNPTCLPNTRQELLDDIDHWIDDSNSKTVYWLNGMAGTGKSTISRTVAHSRSERGDLGASFFFKRGEMDRGNLKKLMSTLAYHLALSIPGVASFIKKALDANPAIVEKSVKEQFEKLIKEPLREAAATATTPSSVVMVIDALDECDQEADIRLLINIFSQTKTARPQFRVLLTSRPELPVRLGFSEVRGSYQDLVLHDMPTQIVEHDMIVFLEDEFKKIRHDFNLIVGDERKLPPDWPGRPIIQSLAQMAVPLFIFAATVCRFIGDYRRRNPRARLQTVLDHGNRSHGSQLEQTYTPILCSQITELPKGEREVIIKDFRVIVGSIVTLASPLSVAALSRLIEILPDAVDERLDALHSVLSIPLERTMPVRLLHLSFRDYLVDPENKERMEFWVDEKLAHRRLVKHCLRVMRSALHSDWGVVLQTLEGRTSSVNSVVFSNDGTLIASGSNDMTVKIWNVATGEEQRTLEGHTDSVRSVVFSKDGTLIASGSYDKTVKIWNVATGINVKSFDTSQSTNVLSFTDDDSVLVTSTGRFSLDFGTISMSHSSKSEPKLGSTEVQGEVDARLGFGINHDHTWITAGGADGRKALWLPQDFRPGVSATLAETSGSVIAIGCPSGRVAIVGFRELSFSDQV
ncbi:hypothetical protein ACHAPD_012239 [Fusarium lateritium]